MLLGKMTPRELYEKYPVFAENAAGCKPGPRTLEKIRQLDGDMTVVMFLGTWCGDSVREVPRFLRLIECAGNPGISLVMYGVDKSSTTGKAWRTSMVSSGSRPWYSSEATEKWEDLSSRRTERWRGTF